MGRNVNTAGGVDIALLRVLWLVVGLASLFLALPTGSSQCDCGDMDHASPTEALRQMGKGVATSPITWGVFGLGFAGLGTLAWRAGWIPRLGAALALWSRFDAEDVEDHPTRSRLLGLLAAHPGASTHDLTDLSGCNRATLLYHLEIMARFGLVNSQRIGRERAWYVVRGGKPDLRRIAVLAVPARARLLDLITATPGLSQADLARLTGLSPATIHHHVEAMVESGLVTVRREGARVLCFPLADERFAASPNYRYPTSAPSGAVREAENV